MKWGQSKKCKYCGIRMTKATERFHKHCKTAYKNGELMKMFNKEEVKSIRQIVNRLKGFF